MQRFTVVFTSTPRNAQSFRTIEAPNETEAVRLCIQKTGSFLELIEVLPFVGNY